MALYIEARKGSANSRTHLLRESQMSEARKDALRLNLRSQGDFDIMRLSLQEWFSEAYMGNPGLGNKC